MELYAVIKVGDGYETLNEILGYADSRITADQMLRQAQIFKPDYEYQVHKIETINYLFRMP